MKNHEGKILLKAAAVLPGVGIFIAVVVGICVYIGYLVDELLPFLGEAGKFAGIVGGFPLAIYFLWRQFKDYV